MSSRSAIDRVTEQQRVPVVELRQMGGSAARPRVLVSAFACHPRQGSEEGNGWNWAVQAARFHDAWLITAFNPDDPAVADAVREQGRELTIVRCRVPFWPEDWQARRRLLRVHYLLWQATALFVALRLHRRVRFDLIHHVTYNAIDFPGLLWLLPPVFVWGPVGGAQEPPAALRRYYDRGWYRERARGIRKRLARVSPFVRLPLRKASVVLAANSETEARLAALGARRIVKQTDIGIRSLAPVSVKQAEDGGSSESRPPLVALWMGYFIRRKGAQLALDVIAEVKRRGGDVRLLVVGDGPLRADIERRIEELGIASEVDLLGRVRPFPEDIARVYRQADVFLFTSLHDTSGQVLLEAMEFGRPIVALDQHGTRDIVSEETGYKVPVRDADQIVGDMAAALIELAAHPERRAAMGEAARRRAIEQFSWEPRGELLRQLYARSLAARRTWGPEASRV